MPSDLLNIPYLSASPLINERCPKADQNVDEEERIDDVVQEFEPQLLESFRSETDIKGDNEDVKGG